jgi:uncharacterized protein YyaL (SSP411 family)
MSIEEVEARVQALELELQKATERSRLAKKAVKTAKALAKEAKKEKRRARRSLIAAQEEHEAALNAAVEASGEPAPSDEQPRMEQASPRKLRIEGVAAPRKRATKKIRTTEPAPDLPSE